MLHKEPQAPPQQAPLIEEQALNGQLEDIEARDNHKDPDIDNNDKNNDNNAMNWLDRRTEGEKTTKDELKGQIEELVEDTTMRHLLARSARFSFFGRIFKTLGSE